MNGRVKEVMEFRLRATEGYQVVHDARLDKSKNRN